MTIKKRTLSRLTAVQVLYQYDFFKGVEEPSKIKAGVLDYYLKSKIEDFDLTETQTASNVKVEESKEAPKLSKIIDLGFLDKLLDNIFANLVDIDETIQKFVNDKEDPRKTDELLREILRLAVLELKFIKDAPKNVIINEYTNLTGQFYEKNITSFVNGVLENIAKSVYST